MWEKSLLFLSGEERMRNPCDAFSICLLPFPERLLVKAYATVPKGFIGNGCLLLSDQISWCFSPQEEESLNLCTQAISLYRAKVLRID